MQNSKARGFTLVEVLVAIFIVSIVTSSCIFTMQTLTLQSQNMRWFLPAQWCANNALTRFQLAPEWGFFRTNEAFNCQQGPFTLPVEVIVHPTLNPKFKRIEVKVFDPEHQYVAHQLMYAMGEPQP